MPIKFATTSRRSKKTVSSAIASSTKVYMDPDAMRQDLQNLEGCIISEAAARNDHFTGIVVNGN